MGCRAVCQALCPRAGCVCTEGLSFSYSHKNTLLGYWKPYCLPSPQQGGPKAQVQARCGASPGTQATTQYQREAALHGFHVSRTPGSFPGAFPNVYGTLQDRTPQVHGTGVSPGVQAELPSRGQGSRISLSQKLP